MNSDIIQYHRPMGQARRSCSMGKEKRKINAVDIVIIAVLIIIVAFLAYKFLGGDSTITAPTAEITYKVKARNIDKAVLESIQKLDYPCQLVAGESFVGGAYVTAVEYSESDSSIEYYTVSDGEIRTRVLEDKVDIIFTITAVVTDKANVEVSTQEIRIGKTNYLKTKYFELSGTVLSVDWA